jgi:hypothetical protein
MILLGRRDMYCCVALSIRLPNFKFFFLGSIYGGMGRLTGQVINFFLCHWEKERKKQL